jgi:hypothetical protein
VELSGKITTVKKAGISSENRHSRLGNVRYVIVRGRGVRGDRVARSVLRVRDKDKRRRECNYVQL